MGRKAKKRIKGGQVAHSPVTNTSSSDDVDVLNNDGDEMMEIKRLKENEIDIELNGLGSSDQEELSLSDDLDIEGDDIDILSHASYPNKVSHTVSCHSDSDIMKNDIFDYEINSNLGEYGSPFLNGMDSEVILDVKHDPPPSSTTQAPSFSTSNSLMESDHVDNCGTDNGNICVNKQSDDAMISTSSQPTIAPSVNGIVGSTAASALLGPTVSCQPLPVVTNTVVNSALLSVVPGTIPTSPVLLPHVIGGVGAANTAVAHIAKIEPGADGKGYVLHLTIPALGLTNVMLSTEGLTFAHHDTKLPVGGSSAGADSGDDQCHQSPRCSDADSPDEINVDTDSPSPVSYPSDDNPIVDSDLGLCTSEPPLEGKIDSMEEETFHSGVGSFMEMASDIAHSDSVDILSSTDQSGVIVKPLYTNAAAETPERPEPDVKLSPMVEHNSLDQSEVDRFVICSDGPMVCVLCAFKTESYSAFKSHIICSHPCWRITKKLSKNRLLVEKSVKMNTGLAHGNFSMPPSICSRKTSDASKEEDVKNKAVSEQKETTDNKLHKSSDMPVYSHDTTGSVKAPKRVSVHPRKKHLIERNKRLFRCTKCLRLFVFEGSIVNHLNDFHNISKPYDFIMVSNDHGQSFGTIHRCPHKNCFVTCTSEAEVEKHRVESHAQVVFRCQICGLAAYNAEAIKTHVSNIHQQQMKDYSVCD